MAAARRAAAMAATVRVVALRVVAEWAKVLSVVGAQAVEAAKK